MSSLTTRRRRPCRMLRGGGAAPFSPQPGIGRRRACTVMLLAFAWVGLAAPTAMAQRSAVTVDLGVLDTLGPADPTANPGSRIRLHRPTPPAQRPAAAGGGKTAPDQAGSQPQAAGKAPPSAAAPAQQANLAPPALVAPPAPSPTPPAPAPAPTVAAERIVFQPDDTNLADEAKQELDRLAARLSADARLYVQLVAYASSGSGGDASQARRLSLSRALAARSYLVDHGVEIKQIDVRPLGNKSEPGAVPDRIDLVVTQR